MHGSKNVKVQNLSIKQNFQGLL